MSNITTTINIADPVGGHQRSQRLIGLATKNVSKLLTFFGAYCVCDVNIVVIEILGHL